MVSFDTQFVSTHWTQFVTDSRKTVPGCFFIALSGERFDGNDFVPKALELGATGVLCSRLAPGVQEQATRAGATVFQVPDTVAAFRELAGAWRRRFSVPVIAIGGSVGKTTSKELIAALLQEHFGADRVLKTQGSQNGFLGVAMTLLELRSTTAVAIVEIGIDEPGAMIQHVQLVQPTHALLTALGPEHLEKLISIEQVVSEEGILFEQVGAQGGHLFIQGEDPLIAAHFQKLCNEGLQAKSTWVRAGDSTYTGFRLPLPGKHNAHNAYLAIAVARDFGISDATIQAALDRFQPAFGRSDLRRFAEGGVVLCDYYNSNPTSLTAAIQTLSEVARPSQNRWVCLGDMLELGTEELAYHRAIAKPLIAAGVKGVLAYGSRMQALVEALKSEGFSGEVHYFNDKNKLISEFKTRFSRQDAWLIKGSRGMRLEEVWNAVDADTNSETHA